MLLPPTLSGDRRYHLADAIAIVRKEKREIAVSTNFGVMHVSKKEMLHALENCEMEVVNLSWTPGTLVLEYPE